MKTLTETQHNLNTRQHNRLSYLLSELDPEQVDTLLKTTPKHLAGLLTNEAYIREDQRVFEIEDPVESARIRARFGDPWPYEEAY